MTNFPLLSYAGAPTSGVDEVQTVTITGTPTSGSFTLTYGGQTTSAIAYNATAQDVQNALQALSNVEAGDVECSGGSLPGTAVTVTFRKNLGSRNVDALTYTSSLGGGSAPDVVIATATAGVRGTHRGAQAGALLQDTTNGVLYVNNGDHYRSQWSEFEA